VPEAATVSSPAVLLAPAFGLLYSPYLRGVLHEDLPSMTAPSRSDTWPERSDAPQATPELPGMPWTRQNRHMKFSTIIRLEGNNTGIVVPDDVVETLGAGKKPAVVVTVGSHTYRSSIAKRGDEFLISLSAANRTKAGVQGGEHVTVDLELDTAPRVVELPPDFAEALRANAEAQAAYEKLSYSNQQRHVLPILDAKTPETRGRRIEKAIATLGGS